MFGIIVRDPEEDAADKIIDVIDDLGLDDDDWDWLLWSWNDMLFVLVNGPISIRGQVLQVPGAGVYAPSVLLDRMEDARCDWLDPRTSRRRGSALEQARLKVIGWQDSMWKDFEEVAPVREDDPKTQEPAKPPRLSSRARPGRRGGRPQQVMESSEGLEDKASGGKSKADKNHRSAVRQNVLESMGLIGATDEDGNGFRFKGVTDTERDTDEG